MAAIRHRSIGLAILALLIIFLITREEGVREVALQSEEYTNWFSSKSEEQRDKFEGKGSDSELFSIYQGHSLFPENSTIFIVDTNANLTKFSHGLICAIESARIMNPEFKVAVITTSSKLKRKLPVFIGLENVSQHYMDVDKFMQSSQLSSFWIDHNFQTSRNLMPHLSDLLRYILLFNYGGIYMDQDVVVVKSFKLLPPNFIVPETSEYINGAVLGLTKNHPFLQQVMSRLPSAYKGNVFSSIGPYLLTTTLKEFCQSPIKHLPFFNMSCPHELTVLPAGAAYPLAPRSTYFLYMSYYLKRVSALINQPRCVAIHYYSSLRKHWHMTGKIQGSNKIVNPGQPLYELMRTFCPATEKNILSHLSQVSWTDPSI